VVPCLRTAAAPFDPVRGLDVRCFDVVHADSAEELGDVDECVGDIDEPVSDTDSATAVRSRG
jgi:hypothetical protein